MSQAQDSHPTGQGERILIIDDSPVIREMLVEILTDSGYTVETAEDGEIGSVKAIENNYSVIICDVHMPRMNGLETVRKIVEAKPNSKILMTDSYPDKLASQARKEGALDCLQKPFDVTELRHKIKSIISEGVNLSER